MLLSHAAALCLHVSQQQQTIVSNEGWTPIIIMDVNKLSRSFKKSFCLCDVEDNFDLNQLRC